MPEDCNKKALHMVIDVAMDIADISEASNAAWKDIHATSYPSEITDFSAFLLS